MLPLPGQCRRLPLQGGLCLCLGQASPFACGVRDIGHERALSLAIQLAAEALAAEALALALVAFAALALALVAVLERSTGCSRHVSYWLKIGSKYVMAGEQQRVQIDQERSG